MRYVTEWDIPDHFPIGELRSLMDRIREGAEATMICHEGVPESIKIVWVTTAQVKSDDVLKRAMGDVGDLDGFSEFDVADHIQELNSCFSIHIERPEQEGVGLPIAQAAIEA